MAKAGKGRGGVVKYAVMVGRLVPTPEAYQGKTNEDVEREILAEEPVIPYVVRMEKVTVFDCPDRMAQVPEQRPLPHRTRARAQGVLEPLTAAETSLKKPKVQRRKPAWRYTC
jgi:hypothetical protein